MEECQEQLLRVKLADDCFESSCKELIEEIGKCEGCHKALIGNNVCTAIGKDYHKECFICANCGGQLEAFYMFQYQPHCYKCYKEKSCQICVDCGELVVEDGVKVGRSDEKVYHKKCLKCSICQNKLEGKFFIRDGLFICEKDTLKEKSDRGEQVDLCIKCGKVIETGKIIRITGAVFHAQCFNCHVCQKNMIGTSFTTDPEKNIYCFEDYVRKFAAKCCICLESIIPEDGQRTAPKICAFGKNFHPKCFKCEDCGMVLDSRQPGKECYPIDENVLCKNCNKIRQSKMFSQTMIIK